MAMSRLALDDAVSDLALGLDRREWSDTYAGEILPMRDCRVALCRDAVQWLIQTRRNPRQEGATVARDSLGFCRTRAALLRLWQASTGEDGAALARHLPEPIKAHDQSARALAIRPMQEASIDAR